MKLRSPSARRRTRHILVPPGPGVRLAAIDIGTNAIRFIAVQMTSRQNYMQLESDRIPVRLGKGTDENGRLNPVAMKAASDAICRLAARIKELDVHQYRAVATAAVRDSPNGARFIRAIRKRCGLRIEMIPPSEEIRLVNVASHHRVNGASPAYILCDVGGGSVDIALSRRGQVEWSESHPIGAVRVLEEYAIENPRPQKLRRLIEDGLAGFKLHHQLPQKSMTLVATGGNIDSLADIVKEPPNELGVRTISLGRLKRLIDELATKTDDERARAYNLQKDRADVILPASIIYVRVAELVGAREILAPNVGLKDGLLLDQAHDLLDHPAHEKDREAVLRAGLISVGRRFGFDEPHCLHVAELGLRLFDGLRRLHKLLSNDRRLLWAAANLHDIGKYIDERKHHKHSCYLIQHTEIPGLSGRDQLLVAAIARYHRKGLPQSHHDPYKHLSAKERARVNKLAMFLRIADALDREHLQRVHEVHMRSTPGTVTLRLQGQGDLLLERWSAEREATNFTKVFHRHLQIVARGTKNGK
ncbi:MAG TPA: Ppx/GppA phosphatase family protein [Candidatus Thermoplasmatota archaeon]